MDKVYNNVNPNKLHDELITSGIIPLSVTNDAKKDEYIAENTWITFADDVDMTKLDEVVASHNPTPSPIESTLAELNRADIDYILIMQGL